jgi:hypothetical protein
MTARHRVSKMLLRHGIVYPKDNTWGTEHRKWLARHQLSEAMSELLFGENDALNWPHCDVLKWPHLRPIVA